jgi:hypothetical protein
MSSIIYTASVVRREPGLYIARADELCIQSAPATTQRGAIKKLRAAVLAHLKRAAEAGRLSDLLQDAGYSAELIRPREIELQANVYDSQTISLVPPRMLLKRSRQNTTNTIKLQRKSYALN